jgi:hypothetical protein
VTAPGLTIGEQVTPDPTPRATPKATPRPTDDGDRRERERD